MTKCDFDNLGHAIIIYIQNVVILYTYFGV